MQILHEILPQPAEKAMSHFAQKSENGNLPVLPKLFPFPMLVVNTRPTCVASIAGYPPLQTESTEQAVRSSL